MSGENTVVEIQNFLMVLQYKFKKFTFKTKDLIANK